MVRLALLVVAAAAAFASLVPDMGPAAEPAGSAELKAKIAEAERHDRANWNAEQLELDRDPNGQFRLLAAVNNRDVSFLVDTGADSVALTVDTAQQAGIHVDPLNFAPVGHGAGGVVMGQQVVIESLNVGGREFTEVDAVVLDGLATNLLGQSVLSDFDSVAIEGDRMVIR